MTGTEQNEIDPTQWVAVDGLGRTVSTYENTGAPRQNRYVGIFYWTWHYNFAGNKAVNINNVIQQYPKQRMIITRKSGKHRTARAGGMNRFMAIIPVRINMF